MLRRYNRRSRSSSFQTGGDYKKIEVISVCARHRPIKQLTKTEFVAMVCVLTDHLTYLLSICGDTNRGLSYLTNAMATPPSTFKTFPVDLCSKPPTKAKQALAISSGNII